MMTRRDYRLIADALNEVVMRRGLEAVSITVAEAVMLDTVETLSRFLVRDNPRYNRSAFYDAVYHNRVA